jgi:hypothetical protein
MTDLAAVLAFIAADLDELYAYKYAGALRMAARELRARSP